jgi:hypothetical protein
MQAGAAGAGGSSQQQAGRWGRVRACALVAARQAAAAAAAAAAACVRASTASHLPSRAHVRAPPPASRARSAHARPSLRLNPEDVIQGSGLEAMQVTSFLQENFPHFLADDAANEAACAAAYLSDAGGRARGRGHAGRSRVAGACTPSCTAAVHTHTTCMCVCVCMSPPPACSIHGLPPQHLGPVCGLLGRGRHQCRQPRKRGSSVGRVPRAAVLQHAACTQQVR